MAEGLKFIHGIDEALLSFDLMANKAITKDYFNYPLMSRGEFKLHLMASELRLLQQAHPNDENVRLWRTGEEYLLNAIHKGLHGPKGCALPSGSIDAKLYPIVDAIRKAQNGFENATRHGIILHTRSNTSFGINPLDQLEPFSNSINGYPYQDGCQMKYCNSNDFPCTNYTVTGSDRQCVIYEEKKAILNQYLEDSAHHILYTFASDEQALKLKPTQNWKIGQHILTVTEFSKISGVSIDNMTQWVRLGVMRHNAKRGAGALTPLDSIESLINNPEFLLELSENYKNQYGIHGPAGIGIIPVAAYIIVACAIAIIAITGLVQATNRQEPTALDRIRGLTTALFSPTGSDFPTGTGTGGGGGTNCPTGYHWDTAQNKCVINAAGGGGGTNCPTGFTWNAAQNKCIAVTPPPSSGGGSNTGLLIAAAAALLVISSK